LGRYKVREVDFAGENKNTLGLRIPKQNKTKKVIDFLKKNVVSGFILNEIWQTEHTG